MLSWSCVIDCVNSHQAIRYDKFVGFKTVTISLERGGGYLQFIISDYIISLFCQDYWTEGRLRQHLIKLTELKDSGLNKLHPQKDPEQREELFENIRQIKTERKEYLKGRIEAITAEIDRITLTE